MVLPCAVVLGSRDFFEVVAAGVHREAVRPGWVSVNGEADEGCEGRLGGASLVLDR